MLSLHKSPRALNNVGTIVNKRMKLCVLHLVVSIYVYLSVCAFRLEESWGLMIFYGILSMFMMTLLLKSELRFEGISLVSLFLLGSYLRLLLPTITYAFAARDGVLFSFKHDYTDALFPCALAMNIYYMSFILLLTYFSKHNKVLSVDLTSLLLKKHLLRTILVLFAWGWIYTVTKISTKVGFLGMFLDGFSSMSLVMLAFASVYKPDKRYLYTFYVLIVLEIIRNVVWGFYKGAIIQPIFIYAVHYFLYCKYNGKAIFSVKSVMLISVSVLFMLGFVYPFMNAKRYAAGWDPTNGITKDIDVKELVVSVIENKDKLVEDGQSNAMLSRFDALSPNAYFYKLVQIDGINPIVLYASVRQFWPKWLGRNTDEDVLMKPGYIVNSYIHHGRLRLLDDLSSAYIGAFASGYFWGWWLGVVLVCLFNAYIVSKLLGFCSSRATNYLSMLVITSIIVESFGCFEEVHSGGLSRAIVWFIFIFVQIFFSFVKRLFYV